MVNYENSKIYKLTNTNTKQLYIGSTTRDLQIRYIEHKSLYTTGKTDKGKSYLLFNETDNVIIELVENYPCKNKKELSIRERYYINSFDCVNLVHPTRTGKEYYEETKKALNNYHNNKKEINEKRLKKIKCECGALIAISSLGRHRRTKKHLICLTSS
tara:strand:+ start:115 stop:588 length:474 start_codon:yes stop_codon:yes gene_type:complete